MVKKYQIIPPEEETAKKLGLVKEGYVYKLAATLTLQDETSHSQYDFTKPDYLERIPKLSVDEWNGFQAETYRYQNENTHGYEMIVAFRGTDQYFMDYVFQNFGIVQIQNKPAREYLRKAIAYRGANRNKFGPRVVVTGNSLGGGLAVHITNHPETADLVTEA